MANINEHVNLLRKFLFDFTLVLEYIYPTICHLNKLALLAGTRQQSPVSFVPLLFLVWYWVAHAPVVKASNVYILIINRKIPKL